VEHVVFFPAPDGTAGFRRTSSLDDAVRLVEHLRNVEGLDEVSVHSLTPVPLSFRAYYRVEVPGGESRGESRDEAPRPVPSAPHVEPPLPVQPSLEPEPAAARLAPPAAEPAPLASAPPLLTLVEPAAQPVTEQSASDLSPFAVLHAQLDEDRGEHQVLTFAPAATQDTATHYAGAHDDDDQHGGHADGADGAAESAGREPAGAEMWVAEVAAGEPSSIPQGFEDQFEDQFDDQFEDQGRAAPPQTAGYAPEPSGGEQPTSTRIDRPDAPPAVPDIQHGAAPAAVDVVPAQPDPSRDAATPDGDAAPVRPEPAAPRHGRRLSPSSLGFFS